MEVGTYVERSTKIIQAAAEMSETFYKKPLVLRYSGGKDSDLILELAKRADIRFEVSNSITTLDSPALTRHIINTRDRCVSQGIPFERIVPTYKGRPVSFYRLIEQKKMLPTRRNRFCCSVLKEYAAPNRLILTGVRWDESRARSKRNVFEVVTHKKQFPAFDDAHTFEVFREAMEWAEQSGTKAEDPNAYDCTLIRNMKENRSCICNPIVFWPTAAVWAFLRQEGVPYCPEYDDGHTHREGCIGCPLSSHMEAELNRYPERKRRLMLAIERMLEARKLDGKDDFTGKWKDPLSTYRWYVGCDQMPGQLSFDMNGRIYEE